jgi:hypothetical protein
MRLRCIEQREVLIKRRTRRLDHHVAVVIDAEAGDRIPIHPTEHGERLAPAQPTKEPLQTAGMKEGVRIGGRARATDHREQLRQVTLKVETAFREI